MTAEIDRLAAHMHNIRDVLLEIRIAHAKVAVSADKARDSLEGLIEDLGAVDERATGWAKQLQESPEPAVTSGVIRDWSCRDQEGHKIDVSYLGNE